MLRPYILTVFVGLLSLSTAVPLPASAQSGSYFDQLLNQLPPPAPAAAPAATPERPKPTAKPAAPVVKPANLAGTWTVRGGAADGGASDDSTLVFTTNGTAFSGAMDRGADEFPLFEIAVTGAKVSFTLVIPGTPYVTRHYTGTLKGDVLTLTSPDEGQGASMLDARREKPKPASLPVPKAKAPPVVAPIAPSPPPVAPPPPPPKPPAVTAAPEPAAPPPSAAKLDGSWKARQTSPGSGAPVDVVLVFAGPRGTLRVGADEWPLYDIKTAGTQVSFTLVIPGTPYITLNYRGVLTGNDLKLASLDEGQGVFTLEGERQGAGKPPAAPAQTQQSAPVTAQAPKPTPPTVLAPKPAPVTVQAPQPVPPAAPVQKTAPVVGQIQPPLAAPQTQPAPQIQSAPQQPPAKIALANPPAPAIGLPDVLKAAPATPAPAAPQPRLASVTPPPAPVTMPKPVPALVPPPAAAPPPPEPAKPPPPPVFVPNFTWIKTPPMGWAAREKLGTMIDAEAIREAADGLDPKPGRAPPAIVWSKWTKCWQGARDASGALSGNKNFPLTMKAHGDYIHAKGLKFGLATAATPKSCGGFEGSAGHESDDARRFAAWGVDVLIYSWCADALGLNQAGMEAAAAQMSAALKASGRDIVLELDQGGKFNVGSWGAKAGAPVCGRTSPKDIEDSWASFSDIGFAQNGGEGFANPGHWNDAGLIQLGNGGMSGDEYRAQLNLWAVLAAPMMLGNEVRIMTHDTVAALTNAEVIAVDQDPLGAQGKRVASGTDTDVWARPLENGATAVAFFNRGAASAPVAVSWEQLGISGPRDVHDLWWHQNIGTANGRYVVFLNPHTSLLLKLSR